MPSSTPPAPADARSGGRRRAILIAAKLACSALLLFWLAHGIDLSETMDRLQQARPAPIVVALIVLLAQALLGAWRWAAIVRMQGGMLDAVAALRLFLIGMFVNQTLSSTVGGDAMRVWRLRASGLPLGTALEGILLERLTGLVTLSVLAAAALPYASGPPALALWLLTGAGVGVALCAVLADTLSRRLAGRIADLGRNARHALASACALPILAAALAIHLLGAAAAWLVAVALGIDIALLPCLLLVPPTLLLATLPISFGGWGVREGGLIATLALVGVPAADALAMSVGFGLLVTAAGLPGGAVWAFSR
ncbi:MAG: lysylphosphatidylglycerol synthase transmembrane domain-containing protein [Alphaproteobacteria bacterium]